MQRGRRVPTFDGPPPPMWLGVCGMVGNGESHRDAGVDE